MRTTSIWVAAVALFLIQVGCGNKKDHQREITSGDRVARGAVGSRSSQPNMEQAVGLIGGDWLYWEEFQDEVLGFLSSSIEPNSVGEVSPYEGEPTGVRFWGDIQLVNGNQGNGFLSGEVSPDSWLQISVWDSFSGQIDPEGNAVSEIPIYFPRAVGGYVDYEGAEIIFEDEYGYVVLTGSFTDYEFQGDLYYENYTSWDGGAPTRGYLPFVIETCGFFRCQ